jgi:hypothetical protein
MDRNNVKTIIYYDLPRHKLICGCLCDSVKERCKILHSYSWANLKYERNVQLQTTSDWTNCWHIWQELQNSFVASATLKQMTRVLGFWGKNARPKYTKSSGRKGLIIIACLKDWQSKHMLRGRSFFAGVSLLHELPHKLLPLWHISLIYHWDLSRIRSTEDTSFHKNTSFLSHKSEERCIQNLRRKTWRKILLWRHRRRWYDNIQINL